LSFLWPGLGQAYVGRRRSAVLFAIPIALVVLVFGAVALQGLGGLAGLLLAPATAFTVVAIVILMGLWRVVSMVDALTGKGVRSGVDRRVGAAALAGLTLVTVLSHGWAASNVWSIHEASQEIFVALGPVDGSEPAPSTDPSASFLPGSTEPPEFDEAFDAGPFATPQSTSERVNVLMIGIDSAEGRTTMLTDTMIVVSVDPTNGDVAMVSFPRDIADFPLPDGRTFTGKINSLMSWARWHPREFPDGPLPTLANSLGYLLGIPVHYYAAVNLAGFSHIVDVVGGVTVDNEQAIADSTYGWLDGRKGFFLSKGRHRLDGDTALAFVRTRKGMGGSDFVRASRQQQLLLALRREVTKPESIANLPNITKAVAKSIKTNFPPERVGEFIDMALEVDLDNVHRVVLGPPYATRATGPDVTDYRIRLDMSKLRQVSIDLFGDASRYARR
jgi:LCP family protein required for cell wall assembly